MTKLIETVTRAGLGSLLNAWHWQQDQRNALAHQQGANGTAHQQMRSALAESQAEKLTADIPESHADRAHHHRFAADPSAAGKSLNPVTILGADHNPPVLDTPAGPEILSLNEEAEEITRDYAVAVTGVALEDGMRRADNLAQAIAFAQEEMRDNPYEAVSDAPVEDDWFQRWRREAETVVNSDIQRLWGRMLATEIRLPGALHRKTLDFVKNISITDAGTIAKVLQFAIGQKMILRDADCLMDCGLTIDDLVLMEDLGVIGGSDSIADSFDGHATSWTMSQDDPDCFLALTGSACLIVTSPLLPKNLKLPAIRLTRTGRDLLNLAALDDPPAPYVLRVADAIKSTGCHVSLARRAINTDGSIQYVRSQAL